MSYYSGWQLGNDQHFLNRVGFCAEVEGLGFDWGIENRLTIAAAPGFSSAYETAQLNGVPNPGLDQSVISDEQILGAVQATAAEEAPL